MSLTAPSAIRSRRDGALPADQVPRPTPAPAPQLALTLPLTPPLPLPLPRPLPLARRLGKHPRLMHHNRLAAAVLLINLVVLVSAVTGRWWSTPHGAVVRLCDVTLTNFTLAILIRQQHVINLLFRVATAAPVTWPLRVRWTLAKVYHLGGVHVGGAVAGTAWFVGLQLTLGVQAVRARAHPASGPSGPVLLVSTTLMSILLLMVVTARPSARSRRHDCFERVHRYGGWSALLLFWVQTVLLSAAGPRTGGLGRTLIGSVPLWILAVLTVSIALPWLRLRRVPVTIERPSDHVALVSFDHGITPFAGSSTSISRNPLREWHSFANVPTPGQSGFRLTISRAGDWTGAFIDDAPSHVWVKGITTAGVANVEKLFRRVVYVATGSGIGPVLPHLLAQHVPARLVWATRDPEATYGTRLLSDIRAVQPDAVIVDTSSAGKPDLLQLAYRAYLDFAAEAVICISNRQLTWQVVHGLEQRGIPAFGAIWDS